jgi:hypothetical protein
LGFSRELNYLLVDLKQKEPFEAVENFLVISRVVLKDWFKISFIEFKHFIKDLNFKLIMSHLFEFLIALSLV